MITAKELKEYVEAHPKQIRRMTFADYPDLFILKYKHEVFWEGKWNEFLRECRGLVVDKNYNVVIRPFTKVFNWLEQGATYDFSRPVWAEQKINGFMAAATYVPQYDKVIVSTTGSLDSPYTKMATEMFAQTRVIEQIMERTYYRACTTFLFEIVHPDDPHIVKEDVGVYLLSSRNTVSFADAARSHLPDTLDRIAGDFRCHRPMWSITNFGNIVEEAKTAQHEGWVVFPYDDPYRDPGLKIKTPYYKTTKWFARMNPEKFRKQLQNVNQLKKEVDEEFFGLIDKIAEAPDQFINLNEQDRISFVENYFKS